jgi:hypothetical protein
MKPLVSIVLEAYNDEHNHLAPPAVTLEGLRGQDYPRGGVELIVLCSEAQVEAWRPLIADWPSLQLVSVRAGRTHYWQMKNDGARAAQGEYVAFLDSDVLPGPRWLSAIVRGLEGGADVTVGPSLYRTASRTPHSARMLAAALPSWGFNLARNSTAGQPRAASLLAHNVAMRKAFALEHPFPEDGRSFSSSLLYFQLKAAGARIDFQPDQWVAHALNFKWWLTRRHFRSGWETYIARKTCAAWPRVPILSRLPIIEPLVLRMGMVPRDALHWWRFRRVAGVSRVRAIGLFPLVLLGSLAARTAEMTGMYAYLMVRERTRDQARF